MEVAIMDHNQSVGGPENPKRERLDTHEDSNNNPSDSNRVEDKRIHDTILDSSRLALASMEAISRLDRTNMEDKTLHALLNRLLSVNNLREMDSVSMDFSHYQKDINPKDQNAFQLIGRIIDGITSVASAPLDEARWETGNRFVVSAIRDAEYYVQNVLAVQSPSRRDLYSAIVSYTYAFWVEVGVAIRSSIKE